MPSPRLALEHVGQMLLTVLTLPDSQGLGFFKRHMRIYFWHSILRLSIELHIIQVMGFSLSLCLHSTAPLKVVTVLSICCYDIPWMVQLKNFQPWDASICLNCAEAFLHHLRQTMEQTSSVPEMVWHLTFIPRWGISLEIDSSVHKTQQGNSCMSLLILTQFHN